jgi:hypothetical protein
LAVRETWVDKGVQYVKVTLSGRGNLTVSPDRVMSADLLLPPEDCCPPAKTVIMAKQAIIVKKNKCFIFFLKKKFKPRRTPKDLYSN